MLNDVKDVNSITLVDCVAVPKATPRNALYNSADKINKISFFIVFIFK